MSESLRRKSDPPQPAPVLSHEDIAEQIEQYLARGHRIQTIPSGVSAVSFRTTTQRQRDKRIE